MAVAALVSLKIWRRTKEGGISIGSKDAEIVRAIAPVTERRPIAAFQDNVWLDGPLTFPRERGSASGTQVSHRSNWLPSGKAWISESSLFPVYAPTVIALSAYHGFSMDSISFRLG